MEQRQTVLIVDDDRGILSTLQRSLRKLDANIVTHLCPLEALEWTRHERFDVIVTDMYMPGMNGLELLAELHGQHPEIRSLMLTANADFDLAMSAVNEADVSYVMAKPWNHVHLRKAVGQLLNERRVEVERDRLHALNERRQRELEHLVATIDEFADELQKGRSVIDNLLESAVEACGAEQGAVAVVGESGIEYFKGLGLSTDFFEGLLDANGERAYDLVVRHRVSLFIEDIDTDPRVSRTNPDGVKAIAFLPLSSNTKEIGFLALANVHGFFTQLTTSILGSLGHLASVAYENAQLRELEQEQMRREQEMELAQAIQSRLQVQEMPEVLGLDLAGWSVACDETGGDYLDVLPLGPNRCGVVVGDASGHGLGAALVMIGVRAGMMSLLSTGMPIEDAFAQLSDRAEQDSPSDRFMTLFYGEFDVQNSTLRYISCGHDEPLLYRASDGSISYLESTGLPIGILPGVTFDSVTIDDLAPGDILIASSDGIAEAFSGAGDPFGRERVEEILHTHRTDPAEVISRTIKQAVLDHVGDAPTTDDKTVLVVKFAGDPSGRACLEGPPIAHRRRVLS